MLFLLLGIRYQRIAWLPVLMVYSIALGVSGKHLISSAPDLPAHGSPRQIMSFGALIVGFVISYCSASSDFTTYFPPNVSGVKVFLCTFLGLVLPTVSEQSFSAFAECGKIAAFVD